MKKSVLFFSLICLSFINLSCSNDDDVTPYDTIENVSFNDNFLFSGNNPLINLISFDIKKITTQPSGTKRFNVKGIINAQSIPINVNVKNLKIEAKGIDFTNNLKTEVVLNTLISNYENKEFNFDINNNTSFFGLTEIIFYIYDYNDNVNTVKVLIN